MRILIHGINFFPEMISTGKYTGELASWLAAQGHQVRVVTALPHYPQWKVGYGYSPWGYSVQNLVTGKGSLKIYRCPLWVPRNPVGIRRILHLISFVFTSLPVMMWQVFWRPDLVICIEPTIFCAPQSVLVSRLSGGRAWLHVQDFELEAALSLNMVRGKTVAGALATLEAGIFRLFDRVSSISPAMVDRIVAKGVKPERSVLFPNWVDTAQIAPLPVPSAFRSELGVSDNAVVVLYAGNLGRKQGLEIIPLAADCLSHRKDILLVVAGEGVERDKLVASSRQRSNMMLIDLVDSDRLNDLLNFADIHLLVQKGDVADLVMPSKLTGMLASGRPVVVTANQGTQLSRTVTGRGMVVPPGDHVALAQAIEKLVDDQSLRRSYGAEARNFALQHLSKETVLRAFEENAMAAVSRATD